MRLADALEDPVPVDAYTTEAHSAAGDLDVTLALDASLPGSESFRVRSRSRGFAITGASTIALRHGVYWLLERLGYRWYFKHPTWNVSPANVINVPIDETHTPAFAHRLIWHTGVDDGGWGKPGAYMMWKHRNRLDGAVDLEIFHSYDGILRTTDPLAPDEAFCPNRQATWPRQLNPDNAYVEKAALVYVRQRFAEAGHTGAHHDDETAWGVASVSPNDGAGWCAFENPVMLANAVMGLASRVAAQIRTEYPNRFVGVYSYSDYDHVPTIQLEPNVLVEVVNFGKHDLLFDQRIKGFLAKGVRVGVYEYFNVPQFNQDRPSQDFYALLKAIPRYTAAGVDVFQAEASDGWGSRGLLYYAAGKLLWEPDADVDAILADFYAKAFGAAADPMRRFYRRMLAGGPITDRMLLLGFRDLEAAELLAGPAQLARIRHVEYYWRYVWLKELRDRGATDVESTKRLYGLVWRLRDLYVLSFHWQSKNLAETIPAADRPALEDPTPPTDAESVAWLAEGLAITSSVVVDALWINPDNHTWSETPETGIPFRPPLKALGSRTQKMDLLVSCKMGETITVAASFRDRLIWSDPAGNVLDVRTAALPWPEKGIYHFTAFQPGNYRLSYWGEISSVSVPCGLSVNPSMGGGWLYGSATAHLHVPSQTKALIVGLRRKYGAPVSVTLTSPAGVTVTGTAAHPERTVELGVDRPAAGVWTISYVLGGLGAELYVLGVAPLIWQTP